MDWQALFEHAPQLGFGLLTTLALLVAALSIGLLLALFLSTYLESGSAFLKPVIKVYLFIFRGSPMLVQFFIIYYGAGQFHWITQSFLWDAFKEPMFCAILALSLNTAAYTTELFRGAIRAIPRTEILAAEAFGFNKFLIIRKIILPNLWRVILPAYSNEVIMVLKGTSLASAITVAELTNVTQSIIGETYETLEFLAISACIYLILNAVIVFSFRRINRVLLV